MMRLNAYAFVFLTLITFLNAGDAGAQSAKKFPLAPEAAQFIAAAQLPALPPTAEKGAGTGLRQEAYSHYQSNGTVLLPQDSQSIFYPSIGTLLYNSVLQYNYKSNAWAPLYKNSYVYNGAGVLTGYDVLMWNAATATYDNYQQVTYTLNANGFATNILYKSWTGSGYVNYYQFIYTRDGADNATDYIAQTWSAGSWVNVYHYSYAYNAQNQVTQYISQNWNTVINAYINYNRIDYNYDASGTRLTDATEYGWSANTWRTAYSSIYYNNGAGHPDSVNVRSYNGTYNNYRRVYYQYDAATGLETSEITQAWYSNLTWGNFSRTTFAYTADKQVTVVDNTYWSSSNTWGYTNTNAYRTNYYYENYTTAVNAQSKDAAILSLSPIPAGNVLDVRLQWNAPQEFTLSVTDFSGRVVSMLKSPAQKDFSIALSVAQLAPGQYMLSVQGAAGGRIARAITVAR